MSSQSHKNWMKSYVTDFEKTAGTGKQSGRGKQQAQMFSIVAVDVEETRKAIAWAFRENVFKGLSETKLNKYLDTIMDKFEQAIRSMDIDEVGKKSESGRAWLVADPKFKAAMRKDQAKAGQKADYAIIAGKFGGAQDWKKTREGRSDGILIKAIEEAVVAANKELESNLTPSRDELSRIGGSIDDPTREGSQFGLQLEHGQYGGRASSEIRVIEADVLRRHQLKTGEYQQHQYNEKGKHIGTEKTDMPSKTKRTLSERFHDFRARTMLKAYTVSYQVKMGMSLSSHKLMQVTKNGIQLVANYAPIVTLTSAHSNQKNANAEENRFITEYEKRINSLVDLPGSSSFDEMARDGMLELLNGNGIGRTTIGAGKPRKKQRTKTKADIKTKINRKESYNVITGDPGHSLTPAKIGVLVEKFAKKGRSAPLPRAPRKSGSSNMPLELLGIINKDLPDTVRANMGAPALTNQTGTFASSVRATDMNMTPQGFPSIGYTYQRDPYEVHEQDHHYDPRKLIDRSMREIAAQYAIGRFYTRRV